MSPPVVASHTVRAPEGGVYRVAKDLDPFTLRVPRAPTDMSAPVLEGNRWDDPAGRFPTMYAATDPVAAFGETIARYRTCEGLLDRIGAFLTGEPDDEYDPPLEPGKVPSDYYANRYAGHGLISPSVEFVDVEHADTHASCDISLLQELNGYLAIKAIDRGVMHAADRRITQTVGAHFHQLALTPDHQRLRGLRYDSRIQEGWECWVIWAPSPMEPDIDVEAVTRTSPALIEAARRLHVTP